ncbi:MAG: FAD-dependent monooxygenase, partial [Ktedonobacteraceae bacterium]|nr:FAD-dependent monooxygenase [Ktedonobacteraceae bacterium]
MNAYDTDVLIVGAGPTGLMAANELRHFGTSCRLIDQKPGPAEHSQALAVHARSLETLDLLGIADAFIKRGYTAPGFNLSVDSRRPIAIQLYRLDTRFPYILILPQSETEAILEEHLRTQDGSVERNITLQSVVQQDDGVIARVSDAFGTEQTIRARYLIDCEGAQSPIRRSLNVSYIGGKYQGVAFLADVKIEGDLPRGYISNFSSSRGFTIFLPFRDDYVRVIGLDFSKQHVPASEPLELSDLQETINAIVPMPITLREPRWLTRFEAPHRVLDRYRVDRVFFAGDAAHLFIPAGGQGMNTGLQDACNLAWKLALVCRDLAPESLLDSYHEERHAVGMQAMHFSDRLFAFVRRMADQPRFKQIAQNIMRVLMPLPPTQNLLGGALSQISLHYRHTKLSLSQQTQNLPRHAKHAGDRVPDLELAELEEPAVRLYELLRAPAYTLFFYISPQSPPEEHDRFIDLARQVQHSWPEQIHTYLVLEEGLPSDDIDIPVLIDVRRQFHTKLGAEHGSLLLVRPDGYLAFHSRASDAQHLHTLLGPWTP